jgi:hypothetical protein
MEKDNKKEDIFTKVKHSAASYQDTPPLKTWSRIESKLDEKKGQKKSSMYQFVYYAAMILLIIGVFSIGKFYMQPASQNNFDTAELYAFHIEELLTTKNTYPVYSVHKLKAAYENIQNKEVLTDELEHNIFSPFKKQGF